MTAIGAVPHQQPAIDTLDPGWENSHLPASGSLAGDGGVIIYQMKNEAAAFKPSPIEGKGGTRQLFHP